MTEPSLPSATQSPRFSGIRTFMRLPYEASPEAGAEVAVIGIPFDTAASFRPGARFGPSGIRDMSVLLRPSNQHHQVNALEALRVVDAGDVLAIPGDIQRTYDAIAERWASVAAAGVVPIGLGGDHSVTLGELRGITRVTGPLALVHVDAHCDTWDNYWGLRYTHGTPFRRAMEEGLLLPGRSIQVGIRGSEYAPGDLDGSRALGFEVLTSEQILAKRPEEVARLVRERVGESPCFLTFDVDFFDPAFAPGTGTPEAGGPPSWFGIQLVQHLVGLDIRGFDVVEVSPPYDAGSVTALLGATLAFEFLGLLAVTARSPDASRPSAE
jgi:agmatinase